MNNKKLVDFKDTHELVKKYADEHCEGNFSMAVRKLIKKGVDSANNDTNKASN